MKNIPNDNPFSEIAQRINTRQKGVDENNPFSEIAGRIKAQKSNKWETDLAYDAYASSMRQKDEGEYTTKIFTREAFEKHGQTKQWFPFIARERTLVYLLRLDMQTV